METFVNALLLIAVLVVVLVVSSSGKTWKTTEAGRMKENRIKAQKFKEIFGIEVTIPLSQEKIAELQPTVKSRLRELRGAWREAPKGGPEFAVFKEASNLARSLGFRANVG